MRILYYADQPSQVQTLNGSEDFSKTLEDSCMSSLDLEPFLLGVPWGMREEFTFVTSCRLDRRRHVEVYEVRNVRLAFAYASLLESTLVVQCT